nr:hypothetical protein [Tanacetum cinerariifolium]
MDQRMNEAIKVAVQIQSDRLHDETQRENDEFLKTVDENMQKIIKEQVKEQVKNKDKKNRLMRIDKLHKFSDGTLTDVCSALDYRLKGIQM